MEQSSYLNASVFVLQSASLGLIEEVAFQCGRISLVQLRILLSIESFDEPPRVSDIARKTEQNPSAISKNLDTLARKGLIVRVADGADRRIVRIRLSERGVVTCDSVRAQTTGALADFYYPFFESLTKLPNGLSKKEARKLRHIHDSYFSDLTLAIESYALKQQTLKELLADSISPNAFYILLGIATKGSEATESFLAKYLNMDKSAVSAAVTELVKHDFIEAERSDVDRRKINLTILQDGESFIEGCGYIFEKLWEKGYPFDDDAIQLIMKVSDLYSKNQHRKYPSTRG